MMHTGRRSFVTAVTTVVIAELVAVEVGRGGFVVVVGWGD